MKTSIDNIEEYLAAKEAMLHMNRIKKAIQNPQVFWSSYRSLKKMIEKYQANNPTPLVIYR